MFLLNLLDLKNKDNMYINTLKKLIRNLKSIEKEFYCQIQSSNKNNKKINELNKKVF